MLALVTALVATTATASTTDCFIEATTAACIGEESIELFVESGEEGTIADLDTSEDGCRQAPRPARYRCNPRLAPSSLPAC